MACDLSLDANRWRISVAAKRPDRCYAARRIGLSMANAIPAASESRPNASRPSARDVLFMSHLAQSRFLSRFLRCALHREEIADASIKLTAGHVPRDTFARFESRTMRAEEGRKPRVATSTVTITAWQQVFPTSPIAVLGFLGKSARRVTLRGLCREFGGCG